MSAIRIGSLFSCIGGLELGIEAAFAESRIPSRVVWQVEQNAFRRDVLARHWPHADRSCTDVRDAGSRSLSLVDAIVFGFPCQDIAFNGLGAGLDGERSGLWSEGRRTVREIQPRFVIVENVPALLSRGLGVVLGDLAALGYDARWDSVSAADVGFPHLRDRVFITAWREWSPIVRAGLLAECECCDDQWCARCESHFGECQCPGPHSDGEEWSFVEEHWGLVAYADGKRMEGRWADWLKIASPSARARLSRRRRSANGGQDGQALADLVRGVDGLPDGVDLPGWVPAGLGAERGTWEPERLISKAGPHWKEQIEALGNVVVPHAGRAIGRWLIEEGLLS